ncbi:AraC family transcriptional regulator [Curtobacterium sp. L1-20]|uniref:AraC family transcriptional regulator n=1 Tax=Curtobacterium sp. L1-20 TaxID=3138181 RepID=UPI003B51592F
MVDTVRERPRSSQAVRFEFSGNQPEDAVRDLSGVYSGDAWVARPTDGPFEYRYTALGDTDVTVRRAQLHGSLHGVVPAGGEYVVVWVGAGSGEVERHGGRCPLPIGRPVLLPPDDEYAFWSADHDHRIVHLDREFVQRIAASRTGDVGPLRFDDRREVDQETARRWEGVLVALARSLRVGGPESSAWHTAKELAVEVFLEAFPPRPGDLPAVLGQPRNARLRAAVQYIHDHAAEPVTVTELSAVSGLSVRSVQESFRRVFDVSPLTYLRHVRLDRVRAELLELDPQVGAVGDVAKRWGFAHLGRFSASYAERFGEYPKQTLRR